LTQILSWVLVHESTFNFGLFGQTGTKSMKPTYTASALNCSNEVTSMFFTGNRNAPQSIPINCMNA
jgi:hypothetical protein